MILAILASAIVLFVGGLLMSSKRLPARILGQSDATDNQGLVWSDALGIYAPHDVVLGLTSDDATVTIVDNGDGTWDLSAPGGGGGGGGGVGNDRRWNLGPGETSIDEFDDGSLDAAWGRVDGTNAPVASVDWTEGADTLTAYHKAADTSQGFHGMMRSIGTAPATGSAWITCLTLFPKWNTNYVIGGLLFADGITYGSGKQLAFEVYHGNGTSNSVAQILPATNYNTFGTPVSQDPPAPGAPVFVRAVYLGSSVWRMDTSPTGTAWRIGTTTTVSSFTPTYVGFTSRDSTGTKGLVAYEFLRRVSGVT